MGFFNELAGWAHIANVNIHELFSDNDNSNETVSNSAQEEDNEFTTRTRNYIKSENLGGDHRSSKAYAYIMGAIAGKKFEMQSIIPDNASSIRTIINNSGYGFTFTIEEVLSAIYLCDVISFVESKGIDLSRRNDALISISNYVTKCDSQVTPKDIMKNTGAPEEVVNMYLGWLNEYAARNKALILGCDITDSCDAAEISEFLRKNNISADNVDIEEIKKEFPKFAKERINILLGTIQLIAFVENRGLDLLNTPKLMDIVSYIAKLEPESGLPSSEKIAEATGTSKELVEKYCGILGEYVQEHKSR